MFYNDIDRIEIRERNGNGKLLERCYNVKKHGSVGVCQIKDKGNWGFCSRACTVGQEVSDEEPYEEAEFRYFDKAPEGSSFSGLKNYLESAN